MATNINTILDWFRTGKKPTQAQFWDSWKSFWHKDEVIPQSKIENLQTSLSEKANIYNTLSEKGDIPASANLNNYTSIGIYHQGLNSNVESGMNYPPEAGVAGMLQVNHMGGLIYQLYHAYGSVNNISIRTYNSTDGWMPWRKLATSSDLAGKYNRLPLTYNAIDCNLATDGIHPGNSWINAPFVNSVSVLENIIVSADWISQTFTSLDGQIIYKRFRHSGTTWTEWKKIVLDNGDFSQTNINNWNTVTSKANDTDVLHKSGDEIKHGSLTINGNDKGLYLGNAGHNASILYNSNGNLNITPRAGYNTLFTAGKVGIGTSDPIYNFVVSNNGNEGLEIALGLLPTEKVILLSYDRTAAHYTSLSFDASSYKFKIQAALALTIKDTGNVGIGTADPAHKFVVSNDGNEGLEIVVDNGNESIHIQNYNRATNHFSPLVYAANKHVFNGGDVGINIASPSAKLHIADGDGGAQLAFSRGTGGAMFGQATNEDGLILYKGVTGSGILQRWHSSGNSSIGTPIDDGINKLQVNGSGKFEGTVSIDTPTSDEHAATKKYVDDIITAKVTSENIADKFIQLTQDYEILESDFGLSSSITFFIDASANYINIYLPSAVTNGRTIHFFRTDTSNNGVKIIANHLGGWNGDPNNELIYMTGLDKQVIAKSFMDIYWRVS